MASSDIVPPSSPPTPARASGVAPAWHTLAFVILLVGLAYLQTLPAVTARAAQAPSRIPTYLLTICFELVMVGYVWLLGLRRRKIPMRELIGGKWQRWPDFWRDVGVAALFWIVVWSMLLVLALALKFSGEAAGKFLLPQTPAELAVFVPLAVTAGFCEELLFRGYLQRQFLAFTGNTAASIALQAVVFGAGHMYQGAKGVVVISVYGAMFGILAAMRKSLRPGMMQHAGQDTISGIGSYFLLKHGLLHILKF